MNERPTFSPFWHRVRAMKPRLRPHVQITRQRYRGRRWHVVHDPTSNQFYRLNPIAHDFVGMLDGSRDVETAWKVSLQKFGDNAPTQNEVIQLISQLYSSNLLAVDTTPETEQLLRRGQERLKKRIAQQAIGIMYFRIKLFNPDRLLTALEPIFRIAINRWGFLLWLAFIGYALFHIVPHWPALAGGFDQAMSPSNWGWLIVVFVVTKAWHELGHGLICRRFGGQVPEFGVMMLVLFPAPYVDASACWAFPSKWRRMAVGAGGMLFELLLAGLAAIVWTDADPGSLTRQLAYNVMLTSSISTVLFNANPLMRFDGYYMLADLLEVPNLAQRSNRMLGYLCQKFLYRLERVTPPSGQRGEQATLIVYGVLAMAYRIFLFFSITLYVMGQFFAIGAALAVWTAAAWFILPVGTFIHWLASSPLHAEHRLRGWAISVGLFALATVALGVVPFPDWRSGRGVVECETGYQAGVFFGTDGFVETAHVRSGEHVKEGDPIATLVSPELFARRESLTSQLAEMGVEERNAMRKEQPGVAMVARERAEVLRGSLVDVESKIDKLVVRAPMEGQIVAGDPESIVGAFVKRGDPVCQVVDVERIRIAASMDQRQGQWLYELPRERYTIGIRPVSETELVIEGAGVDVAPAGQRVIPSAALGFAGGGQIETEPQDRQGGGGGGRITKGERFTVYVAMAPRELESGAWRGTPGERVKLRFTLPAKPLLNQWLDRLAKTLQGRVKI